MSSAVECGLSSRVDLHESLEGVESSIKVGTIQLESQAHRNLTLEDRLAQLEARMIQCEQERVDSKAREAEAVQQELELQEKMLLGQIAYTFSNLFKKYVLQNHPSVAMLPTFRHMLDVYDKLTDTQRARFDALMEAVGFDMADPRTVQEGVVEHPMVQADRYLRRLRNEPAHGNWTQAPTTTLEQLENWASHHCNAEMVSFVKEYMQGLAKVSKQGDPLHLDLSHLPDI